MENSYVQVWIVPAPELLLFVGLISSDLKNNLACLRV